MYTRSALTRVKELPSGEARGFLQEFMHNHLLPENDDGLAIFFRHPSSGRFFFIEDALVPSNKSGLFAKNAPRDLYRSGGGCFIETKDGVLAVPDERGGGLGVEWYKYFPVGLAQRSDGYDLMGAVRREFNEEVLIYSLDHETNFIPESGTPKLHCEALNFTMKRSVMIGDIVPIRFFVNEIENTLELHSLLDLRSLDEPHSIHYNEDSWFRGGRPDIPVVAIDRKGQVSGFYSGQQGFIRLPQCGANLHPAVAHHLGLPTPTHR